MKPDLCLILVYNLYKPFFSIFININHKGFDIKLPNIKNGKSLNRWFQEYLIYLPKTTLGWGVRYRFATLTTRVRILAEIYGKRIMVSELLLSITLEGTYVFKSPELSERKYSFLKHQLYCNRLVHSIMFIRMQIYVP